MMSRCERTNQDLISHLKISSTDRRLVAAFVTEKQNARFEGIQYVFLVEPEGILFNLPKIRKGLHDPDLQTNVPAASAASAHVDVGKRSPINYSVTADAQNSVSGTGCIREGDGLMMRRVPRVSAGGLKSSSIGRH